MQADYKIHAASCPISDLPGNGFVTAQQLVTDRAELSRRMSDRDGRVVWFGE
jgi:hypothetical protein